MSDTKYKRVLLKLSGEMLAGDEKKGIDINTLDQICIQVKKLIEEDVEVAIVVGGGNFWRGKSEYDIERTTSDYIGMLATSMNGLAIQSRLENMGVNTRLQTAIEMREIAEPFIKRKAVKHLERQRVVIFGCGTGNPFFTTDTAAALRAAEINADVILVGKTIDGVYSDDPKINPNAIKYDTITYQEVLNQNLKVMDLTAISLCKENNIPLVVFPLENPENIVRAVNGENVGTTINS